MIHPLIEVAQHSGSILCRALLALLILGQAACLAERHSGSLLGGQSPFDDSWTEQDFLTGSSRIQYNGRRLQQTPQGGTPIRAPAPAPVSFNQHGEHTCHLSSCFLSS